MRKRMALLLAVLSALAGFYFGQGEGRTVSAQTQIARCLAQVPRSWEDFRGGSDYGLAFEDQSGTIRLMRQIPCGGVGGTPALAVEIQRE